MNQDAAIDQHQHSDEVPTLEEIVGAPHACDVPWKEFEDRMREVAPEFISLADAESRRLFENFRGVPQPHVKEKSPLPPFEWRIHPGGRGGKP